MLKIKNIFHLIIIKLLFITVSVYAALPGGSQQQVNITETGSASFTHPVQVPFGAVGIQPELTISYNASSQNSVMGVGWQLTGIRTISRCPATIATEGDYHGISQTESDRFCLDGQKLIALNGQYSEAGTDYRTEIDQFAKVISHRQVENLVSGHSPESFVVYQKDGRILTFGATENSRIQSNANSGIQQWLLSQASDRKGNTIEYQYKDVDGLLVPDRINYTSNPSLGISAQQSVRFVYEGREDVQKTFMADRAINLSQRLKTIETYNQEQIVRSYKLSYELSAVTNRSQLISIEECGYTGECLPPSIFEYTDNGLGFGQAQTEPLPIPLENYQHAGDEDGQGHVIKSGILVDLNGDGFNDLVQAYKDKDGEEHLNAWLQKNGQWVESTDFTPPHVLYDYTTRLRDDKRERHDRSLGQIIDVNGDGLPDWIVAVATPDDEDDSFITWLNTESGWQEDVNYALPTEIMNYADVYNSDRGLPSVARNSFFADLNGDGLVDIASSVRDYFDTVTATTWMNTGTGWQSDAAYKLPGYVTDYFQANTYNTSFRHVLYGGQLIDINRDGLPDLVRAFNSTEARLEDGTTADADEVREIWINENPGWRLEDAYEPPEAIMDYSDVKDPNIGTGAIQEVSRLQDINADGLPDWIKSHRDVNGEDQLNTWLNTGYGWIEDFDYITPDVLVDHSSKTEDDPEVWHTTQAARLLDVNADQLVDFVQAYRDADGVDHLTTWLNTGSGWMQSNDQALPEVITDYSGYGSENAEELFVITYIQLADVSGDLITDLVKSIEHNGLQQNTWHANHTNVGKLSVAVQPNGVRSEFDYASGTDSTIYHAGETVDYPKLKINNPGFLVNEMRFSDGVGGMNTRQYKYGPSEYDHSRRIPLGYSWLETTEPEYQKVTKATNNTEFPLVGTRNSVEVALFNGTVISKEENNFEYEPLASKPSIVRVFLSEQKREKVDLLNKLIEYREVKTTYDTFNNATRLDSSFGNGIQKVHEFEYENDESNWLIGLLVDQKENFLRTGQATQIRQSSYSYDNDGLVTQAISEPLGDGFVKKDTNLIYDQRGNVSQFLRQVANEPMREVQIIYDSSGRLPIQWVNSKNHIYSSDYHPVCDGLTHVIDPNGLQTRAEYDFLCRQIKLTEPTGVIIDTLYEVFENSYLIKTIKPGYQPKYEYFDSYNRLIEIQTNGFDGTMISQLREYDHLNHLSRESLPFYLSNTINWRTHTYDLLDREIKMTNFNGAVTTYEYDGMVMTIINPKGQTNVVEYNLANEIIETLDSAGSPLTLKYDSAGNRISSTDVLGNQFTWEYDILGRKIASHDPNKGSLRFTYNGFAEETQRVDQRGDVMTFSYDTLGRMIQRITGNSVSSWEYDTAPNGIGKLSRAFDDLGFNQQNYYDSFGRGIGYDKTIASRTFSTRYNYDQYSRLSQWDFPGNNLIAQRSYNNHGFLSEIWDIGRNKQLWQVNAKDASQRILSETLGNGVETDYQYDATLDRITQVQSGNGGIQDLNYEYDVIGNLLSRQSGYASQTETFDYDVLNRLTSASVGSETKSVQYDAIGNILYKSDVGNYYYGENGDGPHMLSRIDWNTSAQTFRPHPEFHLKGDYEYDQEGQLLTGGEREYYWTHFDKPYRIWSKGKSSSFRYDPWFNRIFKITKPGYGNLSDYEYLENDMTDQGGVHHETVFYGGKGYQYIINPPHDVVEKYTINAGTVNVVLNVNHEGHPGNSNSNNNDGGNNSGNNGNGNGNSNNNGVGNDNTPPGHVNSGHTPPGYANQSNNNSNSNGYPSNGNTNGNGPDIPPGEFNKIKYQSGYRYILKDHLGSTDVILDDNGEVEQRVSFDPWGAKRNPDWSYHAKVLDGLSASGFTGHESIDAVGLVHMNGRIYDPVLSRFTGPDPIIESVYNTQTYHRYSYVQNQPLIRTDPTGYEWADHNDCSSSPGHWSCPNIPAPSMPTPTSPGIDVVRDNDGNVTNINFVFDNGDVIHNEFDPGVDVFLASQLPRDVGLNGNFYFLFDANTQNYNLVIPTLGLYLSSPSSGDIGQVGGEQIGGVVGGHLGTIGGATVGAGIGAVTGDAIAGPPGAVVGAVLGGRIGAVLGGEIGSNIGSKIGGIIGRAFGEIFGNPDSSTTSDGQTNPTGFDPDTGISTGPDDGSRGTPDSSTSPGPDDGSRGNDSSSGGDSNGGGQNGGTGATAGGDAGDGLRG